MAVELLSPAGGWDSLRAAVSNGADAVYFGAGSFNARRRAGNFSEKELPEVVSYCHANGVRAFLTANILVKNPELKDFFGLIGKAYSAGIDAVIIQDVSFIHLIKEHYPGLEVHVSTQAAVFNSFHKELLAGADRVILPRELTLNQVKEFRENTSLPVEIFVQGALCYSMSGQCLLSSFLGGRSGNRGLCAQPCRKKYNGKYIISTRDLCLAEKIPQIVSAGVSTLKIEGRLRSPEYVAAATALYRRAIDSLEKGRFSIDKDSYADMELAFSREYTQGMLMRVADVVTPDAGGKRGISLGILGNGGMISLKAALRLGDGVGIVSGRGIHGDHVKSIEYKGKRVEHAELGQSVRLDINAHPGDEIILSSGSPRRKPCKPGARKPIEIKRGPAKDVVLTPHAGGFSDERLLVKVYSLKDAYAAKEAGGDYAYYNIFSRDYPADDPHVSPYIPRCLGEHTAQKALSLAHEYRPSSVLCGDPGVAVSINVGTVYLDISGNVFNDNSVRFYNERGVIPVISPELSFNELSGFSDKRFAAYVHGRLPLMSTRYSLPVEKLTDGMNYVFPVRSEGEYKQVLNSIPLGLFASVSKLKDAGVNRYLLDLEKDVPETVASYKKILSGTGVKKSTEEYTLGNYRGGVQ
ncbi:MAG: peptidase U32 family protein [Candidatus Altiarchaeia archaeon]